MFDSIKAAFKEYDFEDPRCEVYLEIENEKDPIKREEYLKIYKIFAEGSNINWQVFDILDQVYVLRKTFNYEKTAIKFAEILNRNEIGVRYIPVFIEE